MNLQSAGEKIQRTGPRVSAVFGKHWNTEMIICETHHQVIITMNGKWWFNGKTIGKP